MKPRFLALSILCSLATGSLSYASVKDYQCDGDCYSSFGSVYFKYTETITADYSAGTMVVTIHSEGSGRPPSTQVMTLEFDPRRLPQLENGATPIYVAETKETGTLTIEPTADNQFALTLTVLNPGPCGDPGDAACMSPKSTSTIADHCH